jgi:hypothetical protein
MYGRPGDSQVWENQRAAGPYIHADSHSAPLPSGHYEPRIPSPPFLGQGNAGYPSQENSFYSSSLPDEHPGAVGHHTPPRNTSAMGYGQPPPPPVNGYYQQPPPAPPTFSTNASFPPPPPNPVSPYRFNTPIPHQQTPPHNQGPRPLPDPYNTGHRPLSRVSSLTQNHPPVEHSRIYGRPSLPNSVPPPPPLTPPRGSPPSSNFASIPQPPPPPPPLSHSFASVPPPPPPPLPTTSFDFSTIPPPPPAPWEGPQVPPSMPQPMPSSSFSMYHQHH